MEDITLEKIKSDVEMMVNNSCDIMVKNSKGLFNNFSFEKNKEFMVNAIIFEYLIRWLDNDNNAAQTINNFAKSKYIFRSDWKQTKEIGSAVPSDIDEALRRASIKYANNIKAQNKVNKKINKDYNDMSDIWLDNKKRYNFLSLNFMDAYSNGYLMILDLLFFRKNILKIDNKMGEKDALLKAYNELNRYMRDIKSINPLSNKYLNNGIHKKNTDTIEFVVSCMQFYLIETSYRFILAAMLAQHIKNDKPLVEIQIPYIVNLYISNIPAKSTISFSPYLHYKNIIEIAFQDNKFDSSDYFNSIIAMRIIMQDTLFEFCHLHPTKTLRHWNQNDFNKVADFLVNDYRITDCLNELILDEPEEGADSVYDYIRAIYKNDNFIDQENFNEGRKIIQALHQKTKKHLRKTKELKN